jgi:PAS domain S-box-containing protein
MIESPEDFLNNSSVGINTVSASGIIEYANQFVLDMLGYKRDEYIGHRAEEFQVDPICSRDMMARLSNFEVLHNYPAKLKAKNETIFVLYNSNVYQQNNTFIHTRCFSCQIEEHIYQAIKENFPYCVS